MTSKSISNKLKTIEAKLDKLLTANTPPLLDDNMFYSWLDTWLQTKNKTIKPKSYDILKSAVERYIKPSLLDTPLTTLTPLALITCISSVSFLCMREVVYLVLRSVFGSAQKLGYIVRNPMDCVPPYYYNRKKGRALTKDEQREFITTLADNPKRNLYLFYLLSGCRCSEALLITWQDIDYNNEQIHIKGSKTPQANRYIPLFPQIRPILDETPKTQGKLFPYTANAVKSHFKRLKHKYGFTFRLHDLRHTFATQCLELGITINIVSKWLGHSNASVTANIYQHIRTDYEKEQASKFHIDFIDL